MATCLILSQVKKKPAFILDAGYKGDLDLELLIVIIQISFVKENDPFFRLGCIFSVYFIEKPMKLFYSIYPKRQIEDYGFTKY